MAEKTGLLLVAYGAGSSQNAQTLRNIGKSAEQRFGLPVRWAYTSEAMRLRLAHARTKSDSVLKALIKMHFERYTQVAVQTLHLIPGLEFSDVLADLESARAKTHLALTIGQPLLPDAAMCEKVARAILRRIPLERAQDEAVVCMAHGSKHSAENCYVSFAEAVSSHDPLIYVGCIKGSILLEDIIDKLAKQSVKTVWLLPLLSVTGKHTSEDMGGVAPKSWKSQIELAGYHCRVDLRGLAEFPEFVTLWLDNLEAALDEL